MQERFQKPVFCDEDITFILSYKEWDIWYSNIKKKLRASSATKRGYWAPIAKGVLRGEFAKYTLEAFVAKFHSHRTNLPEAFLMARDAIFDPSVSPNARAS